jgi:hypothetical protein
MSLRAHDTCSVPQRHACAQKAKSGLDADMLSGMARQRRSDWCLQARMHLTGTCRACPRGRSWTTPATAATSWRPLVRRLSCRRPGADLGAALGACVPLPRLGFCTVAGSHGAAALWRYHDRQAETSCAAGQACRRLARRRSCWWPAAWGSGWATPASSSRCRQTQRGAPASCRCAAAVVALIWLWLTKTGAAAANIDTWQHVQS